MKRLFLFPLLLFAVACYGQELRIWTDASGQFKIQARFLSVKDGKATLESHGKRIEVAIAKLSSDDQAVIREKRLAELRGTHTTWRIKTKHVEHHQERDTWYHTAHVGPAHSGVVIRTPYDAPPGYTHTVTRTNYTFDPVHGEIVSYQRNDVVLSVNRKNVTYPYNFLGKDDQAFLTEYRKAENGE